MAVVDLYNGIYRVLANDTEILTLLGIGTGADVLTKAMRIQKRYKPQSLAVENMPMIAFYAPPGAREGQNLMVYNTMFHFDIYTKDDVATAQKIAKRVETLFDGVINPMMGVENFEAMMVSEHETAVDLANTYLFTVIVQFSISLEK